MKKALIVPMLLLAGCTARVPERFSTMDLGIGSVFTFSGPGRSMTFGEETDLQDYGRDYRITLVVDGGTAAEVALHSKKFRYQWHSRPQYWDDNRAIVNIDGRAYPLVDTWKELAKRDKRFVLVNMEGKRCGEGAALAADGCPPQKFYLRTPAGIIKGPFIRPGGGDPIDLGARYTVTRPHVRQLEYQEILDSVILPDIDFERITAHEAIAFLDREFKRLSPGSYLPINMGLQYYIPEEDEMKENGTIPFPAFSCSASGISLLDALDIICTIARLQFHVEDKQIFVSR